MPALVQFLADGPGDGESIEGRGAAADLVQQDEAPRRGVVQDAGGLDHLDEEGALAARQVVLRADAGQDAVDETDPGAPRRHERAHLGEDDQRAPSAA